MLTKFVMTSFPTLEIFATATGNTWSPKVTPGIW